MCKIKKKNLLPVRMKQGRTHLTLHFLNVCPNWHHAKGAGCFKTWCWGLWGQDSANSACRNVSCVKNVACPKTCLPYQLENPAPVSSDAKHLSILMAIWMAEFYGNYYSGLHWLGLKSEFEGCIAKLTEWTSWFEYNLKFQNTTLFMRPFLLD